MSLCPRLVLIAALAAIAFPSAPAQAAHHSSGRVAKRAAKPPEHHARKPPHHASHTKTNRYRRPAVHRRPAPRVNRRVARTVRRPVNRTVVRTVHRYPVRRVSYRYVRRPYVWGGIRRYHRRYTYNYYPGRYRWRSSLYNRGYGLGRRNSSRGVRGIVEGVQGNESNGTILLKTFLSSSSRFRSGTTVSGPRAAAGTNSIHRFHVNNGTVYEVLSSPRKAGTFASLHKGEQVLILTRRNQASTAQKVELFPSRRR
jgi:hypothetical protein